MIITSSKKIKNNGLKIVEILKHSNYPDNLVVDIEGLPTKES